MYDDRHPTFDGPDDDIDCEACSSGDHVTRGNDGFWLCWRCREAWEAPDPDGVQTLPIWPSWMNHGKTAYQLMAEHKRNVS